MTDLKQRLAAVLASARGQAMNEEGQQFSIEELSGLCSGLGGSQGPGKSCASGGHERNDCAKGKLRSVPRFPAPSAPLSGTGNRQDKQNPSQGSSLGQGLAFLPPAPLHKAK
jgi:hypothetical protein